MAPSALTETMDKSLAASLGLVPNHISKLKDPKQPTDGKRVSFLLDRSNRKDYPIVIGGKGLELYTKDHRTILDASSGAAVSCLGHDDKRVINAVTDQMNSGIPYLASAFWAHETVDELCKELIMGTERKMARVYLTGSGLSTSSLSSCN